MSHHSENRTVSTIVEAVPAFYLLLVHHRRKKLGREKYQGAAKSKRRDAENGEGMIVQMNDSANDATFIGKMVVPIRVAQHDVGCAVGTMLVRGTEETAEIRLNL